MRILRKSRNSERRYEYSRESEKNIKGLRPETQGDFGN